jgi:signal transduction histidine kinase
MLLECDRGGRVLWMSRSTRASLCDPKRLTDIIAVQSLRWAKNGFEISSVRFWKVCEFRDSVLIAALGAAEIPVAQDLASLHRNLTTNFFRLLELERALFERARRRRGGAGKNAVRQIELERQRLGRELHTGVGQMLAAIRWQLEILNTELPEPVDGVKQALENISTLTNETLDQVRSVSRRLHPPEWQRLTLESAIRQLWEISGIPQRLSADLQIDPLPFEPDLEVKVLLYRAFQEAISNVARHSRATRIDAGLRLHDSRLTLSICDNGIGFDVTGMLSRPANLAAGIGLRSIRETAEGLGGNFEVESGPSGTKLVISVALCPAED